MYVYIYIYILCVLIWELGCTPERWRICVIGISRVIIVISTISVRVSWCITSRIIMIMTIIIVVSSSSSSSSSISIIITIIISSSSIIIIITIIISSSSSSSRPDLRAGLDPRAREHFFTSSFKLLYYTIICYNRIYNSIL